MKNPGEFFLKLRNAATVAHVIHLSTKGPGSYATHNALNEFYDGVIPLADRFAEAYMGLTGERISFPAVGYKMTSDPVVVLTELRDYVTEARKTCDDPMIQQIVDDIKELICLTLYMLTLK